MSRIELEPFLRSSMVAGVGWNPDLKTFFAQVSTLRVDYEEIVNLTIGDQPGEITDPQVVVNAIRPWAEIPDGLTRILADHRILNDRFILLDYTSPTSLGHNHGNHDWFEDYAETMEDTWTEALERGVALDTETSARVETTVTDDDPDPGDDTDTDHLGSGFSAW